MDSQIIKIEHRILGNILPGFMYLSKVFDWYYILKFLPGYGVRNEVCYNFLGDKACLVPLNSMFSG